MLVYQRYTHYTHEGMPEDVCRYSVQALVAKVPLVLTESATAAGSSKAKAKLWLTAKNNTVLEIVKSMSQVQYALYTL